MPDGAVINAEYLTRFIAVTNALSTEYAERLHPWVNSPFAWILTLPSRTRGAVGEKIVERWLAVNGCTVTRSRHSGCDRIVDGVNMEIKFSTLWEGGQYVFQQLRDQDYASVFCLGISPNDVNAWLIPKAVAWERAIPQHGGSAGKDTKWLSFQAAAPPQWLSAYGGTLSVALEVLRKGSK